MTQAQEKVDVQCATQQCAAAEPLSDAQRAIRLRDNKRKHRLRQREYVADLERRIAEAREQGIQATKEVQASSQRVVWENSRLRQILHDRGLDDEAINSLIYKDGPVKSDMAPARKAATGPLTVPETAKEALERPDADPVNIECSSSGSQTAPVASSKAHAPSQAKACPEGMCADAAMPDAATPDIAPAPCKLLTILAGNPNADITQTPVVINEENICEESDGVECSRAHAMLMRFATTEEKLDGIARALEEGCVKNGEGGGCRVMKDVMWKTLDRVWD